MTTDKIVAEAREYYLERPLQPGSGFIWRLAGALEAKAAAHNLAERKLQRAMEALETIRAATWMAGCDHVPAAREALADMEAMQ